MPILPSVVEVNLPAFSGRGGAIATRNIAAAATTIPQIVALRREGRNERAAPNFVIAENDVLLATASSKEALAQAGTILGEAAHGHLVTDRRDLDYLRVFASRPTVVGRTLGDLNLPGEKASVLVQVPRRVRRPRRRARPSRRFHGDAQILRRLDQGHLGGKGLLPAGRSSWGTLIGTTAGIIGKFSIGLLMILWFLVAAFVA